MILTGNAFRDAAVSLYGYRWAVTLADRFNTTPKTIRCWASNIHAMPADMRARIVRVIDDRIVELEKVKASLVSNSNDA